MVAKRAARGGDHADACADSVAIADVAAQIKDDPVILDEGIVDEDAWALAERCDDKFHKAVVIQVDKGRPALITTHGIIRAHLFRDVRKLLTIEILKDRVVLL